MKKPNLTQCPQCQGKVKVKMPHPQDDWNDYATMTCENGHINQYKVKVTPLVRTNKDGSETDLRRRTDQ